MSSDADVSEVMGYGSFRGIEYGVYENGRTL